MKINGRKTIGPNRELAVIPRPSTIGEGGVEASNDVVFEAEAVLDYSDFEKLCPEPQPPQITRPGGIVTSNPEAPEYKRAQLEHNQRRFAWMILRSLQATPNLEWEQVKLEEPETWNLYSEELKESGFTPPEINRVIQAVLKANGLDDTILDQARQRFLATRAAGQSQ